MLALTSNEEPFDFQTLAVDGKDYTSMYWKHQNWKNSET
jgi:hypothetical protein